MIEILGQMDGGRRWIAAIAPPAAEQEELVSRYDVSPDVLAHALDEAERPRVAQVAGATLVVLRAPRRMAAGGELPWTTTPVSLVLTTRDVLTIAPSDTDVVARARAARVDGLTAPHRVVLAHVRCVADAFLDATADIERAIDLEEARLARSLGNREVLELVRLMKSLVHFTSALRSLELTTERLLHTTWLEVPADDRGDLEDTLTELRQALETCNLERETLAATMDAFASVISNNLNDVMKLLAAVTVILTPPLAVAGYWGMNVPLPFADRPWSFAAVVAFSVLLSFFAALELRRRRWL